MTSPTITAITHTSKRGNKHYLTVGGVKVRVTADLITRVEFNYDRPFDGYGPTFCTDYMGTIYRDSDREYVDEAATYFYPYATHSEAALFNAIIKIVAEHT